MSINQYVTTSFFSSKELPLILLDLEKFSISMLDYGQKIIFLQILPLWQCQCILNLAGRSNDPLNMEHGEAMDKQHIVGNENDMGEKARWSFLMQIAFYMGDLELASTLSVKLQSLKLTYYEVPCSVSGSRVLL